MKLNSLDKNLRNYELIDVKIDLKIFNKNNKVYKEKIIPLKVLKNLDSTSRE